MMEYSLSFSVIMLNIFHKLIFALCKKMQIMYTTISLQLKKQASIGQLISLKKMIIHLKFIRNQIELNILMIKNAGLL